MRGGQRRGRDHDHRYLGDVPVESEPASARKVGGQYAWRGQYACRGQYAWRNVAKQVETEKADSVARKASVVQTTTERESTPAVSTRTVMRSGVPPPWFCPGHRPPQRKIVGLPPRPPALPSHWRPRGLAYSYERELLDWIAANRGERLEKLRHIDIIDFDNTLFKSPVPNDKVWDPKLVCFLKSTAGRWFQDVRTLSEPNVPTRKEGFIREMADIVRASNRNDRALTVLLTGRMRAEYGRRIDELLAVTDLRFDLVCLKDYPLLPDGTSSTMLPTTMAYKLLFLDTLLARMPGVKTMTVWDDRKSHAETFRRWLDHKQQSGRLHCAVSHFVQPRFGYLPYELERKLVFQLIEDHNRGEQTLAQNGLIKAAAQHCPVSQGKVELITIGISYTGVMLDLPSIRLLLEHFPPHDDTWRITADHVTLCPGPARPEDVEGAGGWGAKYSMRVTHVGYLPDRALAVRVQPVQGSRPLPTKTGAPHVTIAYNDPAGFRAKDSNFITNWTQVDWPHVLSGTLGVRPIIGMQWV